MCKKVFHQNCRNLCCLSFKFLAHPVDRPLSIAILGRARDVRLRALPRNRRSVARCPLGAPHRAGLWRTGLRDQFRSAAAGKLGRFSLGAGAFLPSLWRKNYEKPDIISSVLWIASASRRLVRMDFCLDFLHESTYKSNSTHTKYKFDTCAYNYNL